MAGEWDSMFGHMEEETSSVTFIVLPHLVLCRQQLDKNWDGKSLLYFEGQPLTSAHQDHLSPTELVKLGGCSSKSRVLLGLQYEASIHYLKLCWQ